MDNAEFRVPYPPIVEAIVDIDCDLPPDHDLASLESVARDRLRDRYPKFAMQHVHEFKVKAKASAESVVRGRPALGALRFLHEETSVSRHGREPSERLWQLGKEAAGSRNLHGVAFITAANVRATQLNVEPDEPPLRHAVIRGWPQNSADPDAQKAQQKERALVLASAAGPPLLVQG